MNCVVRALFRYIIANWQTGFYIRCCRDRFWHPHGSVKWLYGTPRIECKIEPINLVRTFIERARSFPRAPSFFFLNCVFRRWIETSDVGIGVFLKTSRPYCQAGFFFLFFRILGQRRERMNWQAVTGRGAWFTADQMGPSWATCARSNHNINCLTIFLLNQFCTFLTKRSRAC